MSRQCDWIDGGPDIMGKTCTHTHTHTHAHSHAHTHTEGCSGTGVEHVVPRCSPRGAAPLPLTFGFLWSLKLQLQNWTGPGYILTSASPLLSSPTCTRIPVVSFANFCLNQVPSPLCCSRLWLWLHLDTSPHFGLMPLRCCGCDSEQQRVSGTVWWSTMKGRFMHLLWDGVVSLQEQLLSPGSLFVTSGLLLSAWDARNAWASTSGFTYRTVFGIVVHLAAAAHQTCTSTVHTHTLHRDTSLSLLYNKVEDCFNRLL